jgi:tetratricopeptide (TPR) repeat protein
MLQLAASVQLSRGKFDEAKAKLDRALEIDPTNPTTHYFVGLRLMNQPKADTLAAIEEFKKGKDSQTMGVDSSFALSECLSRRSDIAGAVRELEGALQRQPQNKRVRLALIDKYLGLTPPRTVDAERAITEGKRVPGMAEDVDLMQREVSILASKGDSKKAAELINRVMTARPDDMGVIRKSLDLLLKSRRYNDVNDRVAEVLKKDPTAWWAYVARATAKRYQDRKAEALQDFEAALDAAQKLHDDVAANDVVRTMGDVIGPDEAITRVQGRPEPKWKIMTARLQQTKGDTAAAVRSLEAVLAQEDSLSVEDKINAYRFGGTLYLVVADAKKSKDCYMKLLELAPEDMTALNNLACLLAEVVQPPDPKAGLQYSQRAFDIMSKQGRRDALVLDTHGWLLTLSGDTDGGIEKLRTALQIKRIPDAHYHLGEAYLKKDFADEAVRELQMAHDLYKQLKTDKQPVDPSLEAKIEGTLAKATMMANQKNGRKSTANAAPTSP